MSPSESGPTANSVTAFERAREYTRALNAVKLERMFAAPFVCQLGLGHQDGVYQIAPHPSSLSKFASGSADGVVKTWDLTTRDEVWQTKAHDNTVKGLAWVQDRLLTCGTDGAKLFADVSTNGAAPAASWLGSFTSLSHHRSRNAFAASGSDSTIKIFDLARPGAPEVLRWSPSSTDTVNHVCFNQVEQSILAATSTDRSIVFYDLRTSSPLSRVGSLPTFVSCRAELTCCQTVLHFATNKLDFNPMEAFNFACASEDHNIYSTLDPSRPFAALTMAVFDMRKMDRAQNILKDHVAAVMDVKFSPTGEELASASYDRTIRLWKRDKGHSRDIYHTKRMQRWYVFPLYHETGPNGITASRWHGLRIANSSSAGPTRATSGCGGRTPARGRASYPRGNASPRSTTRPSWPGTATCRSSAASSGTVTSRGR